MFNFLKFKKVPAKTYLSSSEFCSSGHPDRLCDNLASIVIQDIQAKDGPNSHAAIEVFLTHDSVIFAGEATTSLNIDYMYLKSVTHKGFERSGYIKEMRKYWTKDEVLLPSNLKIVNKICAQSPDIALGTTDKGEESGWNDQGVYFSSAEATNPWFLGTSQMLAMFICEGLQHWSRRSILEGSDIILGPDNKCVVTTKVADDGFSPIEVTAVTIAVAHSSSTDPYALRTAVKSWAEKEIRSNNIAISPNCEWVINGTGRFVVHGPISDTSMTGRKISVNHPSAGPLWSNKMIGGGSLVKPSHASDLILNLMSRFIANVVVGAGLSTYAVVGCAGAIGQHGVQSLFIKGDESFMQSSDYTKVIEYFETQFDWAPIPLARMFGFFDEGFDFGIAVDQNFFGCSCRQPWEPGSSVVDDAILYLQKWLRI